MGRCLTGTAARRRSVLRSGALAHRSIERFADGSPQGTDQTGRFELFWDQLAVLPITVEPPLSLGQTKAILALCERHGLTVYDGTYLELAKRRGFPLATLDSALLRAASEEGVPAAVPA